VGRRSSAPSCGSHRRVRALDVNPGGVAPPLPQSVLYATSARIGGTGLDSVAHETLRGLHEARCLGLALGFANQQRDVPPAKIRTLRRHPVRLLSCLGSTHYYGAKKHALDAAAARCLERGAFDLFHGWSGESVRSLAAARFRGLPTVLEIPTWHRDKGQSKRALTRSEREAAVRGWRGWLNSLLVSRQQVLHEYELADVILVLSAKAEETFLAAGVPAEKLFRHSRGVDIERFRPGSPPTLFRAVFVGALIQRKGVHHLIEAWKRLALRDAELVLVGTVHSEIKPFLSDLGDARVRVTGFVPRAEELLQEASVHVFPSLCEGSAKVTYEAAACGLPQIATREAGDVVVDGLNGLIVPAGDTEALAQALKRLYRDPELRLRMGQAGRRRVEENFTWNHFRARVLDAYRLAMTNIRRRW
jgi:glycosyltransferase involved in cell wall biosynthesis